MYVYIYIYICLRTLYIIDITFSITTITAIIIYPARGPARGRPAPSGRTTNDNYYY